jgi:hypothetical protein
MRKIRYTLIKTQCSIFVKLWQAIAPNGRFAAILSRSVKWTNFASVVAISLLEKRSKVVTQGSDQPLAKASLFYADTRQQEPIFYREQFNTWVVMRYDQ